MSGRSTRWVPAVLVLAICALAVALRFYGLGADPRYYLWHGYITDEGRWVEHARSLALFGELHAERTSAMHLVLSPLYQAVQYVFLELLPISFATVRLYSAMAGALLLGLPLWLLRHQLGGAGLAVLAAWLGLDVTLVAMSRLAVPELPSLMFLTVAFLCLAARPPSVLRSVAAGLLVAVACGTKGTAVMVAPVILVLAAVASRGCPGAERARQLGGCLLGVAVPALAGLALALASGALQMADWGRSLGRLLDFVSVNAPYVMLLRTLTGEGAVLTNVAVLVLWLAGPLWWYGRTTRVSAAPARILELAAIWLLWAVAVSCVFEYWPERYLIHTTVPAALVAAAGMAIVRAHGMEPILGWLTAPRALPVEVLRSAYLTLPTAALAASALASLSEEAGLVLVDRAREKVLLLVAAQGAAFAVAFAVRHRPRWVAGLLLLPLLAVLAWLALRATGRIDGFWRIGDPAALAAWLAGLGLIGALAAAAGRRTHRLATVLAVLLGLIPFSTLARFPIPYTYAERDAAQAFGELVHGSGTVLSQRAASIFLENRVRFTENRHADYPFRDVVTYHQLGRDCCELPIDNLAGTYRPIAVYSIPLHQSFGGSDRLVMHRRVDDPAPAAEQPAAEEPGAEPAAE